jgi:hypothetical protein
MTFNQTGWMDNYNKGIDTPNSPLIGTIVKTKREGEVGTVERERNTPLGPVIQVHFTYPKGTPGKVGEGETLWFWKDEVEQVSPMTSESLAAEDLAKAALDELAQDALKELRGF